ncbi:MAG: IS91 family transposase [Gammaproteobacteria bacterium]
MELASLIQQYAATFMATHGARLLPSHRNALDALTRCRTPAAGELQVRCTDCAQLQTQALSCGHRSCPKCQNHEATQWLNRQQAKLLPVEYFMTTFTLPSELRRLDYHPPVHVVVPGGGIDTRRRQWKKKKGKYLFNEFALAKVFRARFLAAVNTAGLALPEKLPHKWVVDCTHVGKGLPALQYLSRYLYRGVISENNIIANRDGKVTFQYTDSRSGTVGTRTLKGEDFLWLVLQHVLPKGFRRVRDYGFLHGNAKKLLSLVQLVLRVVIDSLPPRHRPLFKCPHCQAPMTVVAVRQAAGRSGSVLCRKITVHSPHAGAQRIL